MKRRASNIDANQAEVVGALRDIGASVAVTSHVGEGFPDLVVGFRRRNFLIEVKDGGKPPSARRLTPEQEAFAAKWGGQYVVVTSADEAITTVTGGA